jgi:predicted MFS family arabinose efflux permease
MDPIEFLTAIIEASIALIGFSGLVVVLGRRPSGEWSSADRTRLTLLLATGFVVLACTLLALVLLSAGLSHAVVWAWSSIVWVVLVMPVALWVVSRVVREPAESTGRPSYYSVANFALIAAAAAVQVANAAYLAESWPFLLALAVLLLTGVVAFFRLLWFGIFR